MFTITHADIEALKIGEDPETKEPVTISLPAGLVIIDERLAKTARTANLAGERVVICTAKHYVNETPTVCYGERQTIGDQDHALRALALGKARVDPPLGDNVAVIGVLVGDEIEPLEGFADAPPAKTAAAPVSPPPALVDNSGDDTAEDDTQDSLY